MVSLRFITRNSSNKVIKFLGNFSFSHSRDSLTRFTDRFGNPLATSTCVMFSQVHNRSFMIWYQELKQPLSYIKPWNPSFSLGKCFLKMCWRTLLKMLQINLTWRLGIQSWRNFPLGDSIHFEVNSSWARSSV